MTEDSVVFLSIVFCTDSASHFREIVRDIQQLCSLMPNRKMELVVVAAEGRNLEDDIREISEAVKDRLLIRNCIGAWGARGASRNLGFQMSSAKWVYFLDQDTRLPRARIKNFVEQLDSLEHDNADIFAGPYISDERSSFWGRRYNRLANVWLASAHREIRFLAGNVIFKRASFENRLYDEKLENGGEEIELAERVLEKCGVCKISEDLGVVHIARHSFTHFVRRHLQHGKIKRVLRVSSGRTRPRLRQMVELSLNPVDAVAGVIALIALAIGGRS